MWCSLRAAPPSTLLSTGFGTPYARSMRQQLAASLMSCTALRKHGSAMTFIIFVAHARQRAVAVQDHNAAEERRQRSCGKHAAQ